MEYLYGSIWSWGNEEDYNIHSPYWKEVDEYRDPIDPALLSEKIGFVTRGVNPPKFHCITYSDTQ